MRRHITHHSFSFLLCSTLIFAPSCIHKKNIDKQTLHIKQETDKQQIMTNNPPPITIWVHGTVFFTKPPYYEIYHKQPTLIKANLLPEQSRFHRIAQTIVKNDPEHFSLQQFYIFCWSGHFSIRERKAAAKKLYQELLQIVESYQKQYHCYPVIRIIAHSHGGNLALHMAKIQTTQFPLSIKSLILLACPVQEKTMHLINTPMFQRIYSLYSSFDLIQVLAPQLRRLDILKHKQHRKHKIPSFSARLFPQMPHIIQAKIKINDFPISHSRFSSIEFAEILPKILHKLDIWDEKSPQKARLINKYKLLCIYKKAVS